jgi:hypothetical protein
MPILMFISSPLLSPHKCDKTILLVDGALGPSYTMIFEYLFQFEKHYDIKFNGKLFTGSL